HALQCYSCRDPVSADKCLDIVNCTANDTMCRTEMHSREDVYPFQGDYTVKRACSSKCIPSGEDDIGLTRPVSCCNTDLCNHDGAAGLHISYITVGFSAASFFLFLRTGL
ncbi:PREDICTED: ly6/PLAUR domain-containing protein 2-like, partial [Gekko japonicus]|uniref:Ly6/PLAUR domain-containing protein 2-like n=1 Tax=Gekko japonicus TaxID=146911 RepID=A0ABM1K7D0_GEKJA